MKAVNKIIMFCFVLAVFFHKSDASAAVAAEVISLANQIGAPLREEATNKLKGEIFGSGRAARSTDVVILNTLSKNFRYEGGDCDSGGWSSTLLPVHEIPEKTSVVYGGESHGFLTGVICRVKYTTTDNSWFEVTFGNPYVGSNWANANSSPDIQVQPISSTNNNNFVKVILR